MEYHNYHFDIGKLKQRTASLEKRTYEQGVESAAELTYILRSIDQLTTDIGRVLLKAQALTELLIESGVIDPLRLDQVCRMVDELDGKFDGVLDPAIFRTDDELERYQPTRVLLSELEKEDESETPEEFLKRLEDEQTTSDDSDA